MNRTANVLPTPIPPSLDEILAVPDTDYMSDRQLMFFQARLNQERDTLLEAARETVLHLQDNEATADPSDRASLEEDYTLELQIRDRERKHLQNIDRALARIENRTYGWCEESGEPIGIGRLLARPTTTYCLEVQEHHEAHQKRRRG